MISFDAESMVQKGELIYSIRPEVEAIAKEAFDKGIRNIFLIASGGSVAVMEAFDVFLTTMSNIPVYSMTAADYIAGGHKQLGPDSLVITYSKSGTTMETVAAAKLLKDENIPLIAIVSHDNTPLGNLATYVINYHDGRPQEMPLYFLIFSLMKLNGEFDEYDEFADQLVNLPQALVDVSEQVDEKAHAYAQKYQEDPYQIWIGSGNMWGITYSYSMCVLEESQWLRTKSVTSPEFFHGTLELVDKDVCVTLLKTEGPTRGLDERVERFAKKYTDNFNLFDTKDFALRGIDEKFRQYVAAPVMWAALRRVSKHYEAIRQHSLDTRRYYRKVEY